MDDTLIQHMADNQGKPYYISGLRKCFQNYCP